MKNLVYATRRSKLALAQSRALVSRISETDRSLSFTEEQVVTTGDRIQDRPLSEVGGKGLFVKEIEEALLEGRAQLAIHSVKDVPAFLPDGLVLACIPVREDPRDALVSPRYGTLEALPQGATVGTSSLRRGLALAAVRPDLRILPLRGNVDTRLRKVDEGEYDGIVLAAAGLHRLDLAARITELLAPEVSLPAIGQGALGVECREDDEGTREILERVHHADTARAVFAERGVMRALEGDCKTPIAAHAVRADQSMLLRAWFAAADGSDLRRLERKVAWPSSDADAFAFGLDAGARLKGARTSTRPPPSR